MNRMQGGSRSTMSSTNSFVLNLLSQVEDMSKKPQLDQQLSDVLDQFLEQVRDSDAYLDNGIFNINFSEVALFFQNCAQVYGKKVDTLWEYVFNYQKEVISLERETAKREQAEQQAKERQMRYKRKRKIELARGETNVSELLQLSANVQNSISSCENLQKSWMYAQVRDRIYSRDTTRDQYCIRGIKCPIAAPINTDCDGVINFRKLKLNSIVFELSHEYPLFVGNSQGKNPLNVAHFYETDNVLQEFLIKEKVNYIEVEKIYREKYRLFYSEHLATKANSACAETSNKLCPKRLMTHVKRLSEDVLQHYLERDPALQSSKIKRASSTAPSLGGNDSGFYDYTEGDEHTEDTTIREDVTLPSENSEHGMEADLPITMESEENNGILPTESTVLPIAVQAEENCEGAELPTIMQEAEDAVEERTVVEEVKECNVKRKRRTVGEERCKKRKKEVLVEVSSVKKERRSSRKIGPKVQVTVSLVEFEDFVAKHYNAEEGEGSLETQPETDHPETPAEPASPIELLVVEELIETGSVSDCDLDTTDDIPEDTEEVNNNEEEAEKNPNQPPPVVLSQSILKRLNDEKKQREKVDEWKQFMGKKLRGAKDKADFDIHYYGSQIMDSLSEGENKKFGDVMQGKSSAEVCRYFLATLQLANTENVDIVNPSEGQLADDTLELKLLSKERYHENLRSFMAPSEESFQERLTRARGRRQ